MELVHTVKEQVASLSSGSVGSISYFMFIELTITRVPSGFSGYKWLDTKIVLKKNVVKHSNISLPAFPGHANLVIVVAVVRVEVEDETKTCSVVNYHLILLVLPTDVCLENK